MNILSKRIRKKQLQKITTRNSKPIMLSIGVLQVVI